jgi:hypothetical protein
VRGGLTPVAEQQTFTGMVSVFAYQPKLTPEQRIADLRDQARYLADEIWAREGVLPVVPERICPCCSRAMPPEPRAAR